MINEEKVKIMTRLAIYEGSKGKQQLNISKYYKRDYVRFQMFRTAVTATVAFIIIVAGILLLRIEEILNTFDILQIKEYAVSFGISYIIFLVIYMVSAHVIYSIRYEKIKPDVLDYNEKLKALIELYSREEMHNLNKRTERSVILNDDDIDNY